MIGGMTLEETLTCRDKINSQLRVVLDEATGKWGIRVNRVELKSIDPPASIQEAMEKQMRAERDRRAAILTAEGVKQSQILTAEGEKQSAVLRAEGARTAAILRAEGEAKAIETVFEAIHEGDPDHELLELPVPADAAADRRRARRTRSGSSRASSPPRCRRSPPRSRARPPTRRSRRTAARARSEAGAAPVALPPPPRAAGAAPLV